MFVIPESFPWSPPWLRIRDDYTTLNFGAEDLAALKKEATGTPHEILNDELHREMPEGHVLYRVSTEAVAVCTVTHKDFVFVTEEPAKPIAIVHLTWSQETDPIWPRTRIFTSLHELQLELQQWADDDFWVWPGNSGKNRTSSSEQSHGCLTGNLGITAVISCIIAVPLATICWLFEVSAPVAFLCYAAAIAAKVLLATYLTVSVLCTRT